MPKDAPDSGADVRHSAVPPDPNTVVMTSDPLVTDTSAPATPASAALKSPVDHARELKAVKTVRRAARINKEPAEYELFHWQHAAAEALHGWKQHAHHEQKPLSLSFEDYKAALLAASHPITRRLDPKTNKLMIDGEGKPLEPVNSHEAAGKGWLVVTDYEPHAPALSIHKDKG